MPTELLLMLFLVASPLSAQSGTIIVEKVTVPPQSSGDTPFRFTTSGFTPDFRLSHGESLSRGQAPGTYTVTELLVAHFPLTNITCTDSDPSGTASTVNLATRTATIELDANETVTCRFTNTENARLWVRAFDESPTHTNPPQFFDYVGDLNFSLFAGSRGFPGEMIFSLTPGVTYTVTQQPIAGWGLFSVECGAASGSTNATVDTAARSFTWTPQPGEAEFCDFNNTNGGGIRISLESIPSGSREQWVWEDATISPRSSLFSGQRGERVQVGTTDAQLSNRKGWEVTSIICDDTDSFGDPATRTATYEVDLAEIVECTYVVTHIDDFDGVPTAEEDAADNGGDGNGDFILDSQQLSVASLLDPSSGSYYTLEVFKRCEIGSVTFVDPATLPPDPLFPRQQAPFFSFERIAERASCPGRDDITLLYHGVAPDPTSTLRVYGPTASDPTPHWYTLPATFGERVLLNGGDRVPTLEFTIADGGLGDDPPNVVDSSVVFVGGPALAALPASTPIPVSSTLGRAVFVLALLLGAFWTLRRFAA